MCSFVEGFWSGGGSACGQAGSHGASETQLHTLAGGPAQRQEGGGRGGTRGGREEEAGVWN